MFKRPPSHLVAHRGRGLPTISSALAVLAIAGLAVGACTAPAAGGALSRSAFESFDAHRAKEQQRNAVAIPATEAQTSDDSWDSLRKEHQRTVASTLQAAPAATAFYGLDTHRAREQRSDLTTLEALPLVIPNAVR